VAYHKNGLLRNISLFQSVVLFLVGPEENGRKDDGSDAEADEDEHGNGEVGMAGDSVTADDVAGPHGYEHQADVLNVIDDAVGGAKLLQGYNLGDAGPHGAGHERERDAHENHDEGSQPSG